MGRTLESARQTGAERPLNLPETRLARLALHRLERAIRTGRCPRSLSPLYLHGPSGCGKSYLVGGLLDKLSTGFSPLSTTGRDLSRQTLEPETLTALETATLLVIEDVTTFPAASGDLLATLLDRLSARRIPVAVTAPVGPAQLRKHGARLRSRLSGGLVLHLPLLAPESRRRFLLAQAAQSGLTLADDALAWLVQQTPGSFRQLLGAITQLAGKPHGSEPLSLAEMQTNLGENSPGEALSVERITREVGRFYKIPPARLRGKSRQRGTLVPRQIGMYLARTLTELSLDRIGAYFGGRDHATVLHACRKVEQALVTDPALAGAIRSLRATLC
jgi:chromosomal replication initiator protein